MDNAKENVIQDGERKGLRRSERIAGRRLKDSFTNTTEFVKPTSRPKPLTDNKNKAKKNTPGIEEEGYNKRMLTKASAKTRTTRVSNNINKNMVCDDGSGIISNCCIKTDDEKPEVSDDRNCTVKEDTYGIRNSLKAMAIDVDTSPDGMPTVTQVSNENSQVMLKLGSKDMKDSDVSKIVTPTSLFKTREGVRTPMSGSRGTPGRVGVSPNPRNFLSKADDPVVQRILTPKKEPNTDQQPTNVPKSAMYFHHLVVKEEIKFKECCDKWNKILEEDNVPEEAHGNILSAIGQALLFQNKRFKQFKELIELHKDKSAEKAAYASDLHGFWEMIFYQVEDVHKRFADIELLRLNNWEEKKVEQVSRPKVIKKVASQIEPKQKEAKTKKTVVSSKFKMFRQQMMAKKLAAQQNSDTCF